MKELNRLFRPSSSPAILNCAYFESDEKQSEYAEDGTQKHKIFEKLCSGDLDAKYEEGVEWSFNKIDEILDGKLTEGLLSNKKLGIKPEYKVIIEDENFNQITYGTADLVTHKTKDFDVKTAIFDIKTGHVIRDYTPQLQMYALGIMQELLISKIDVYVLYTSFKKVEAYTFEEKECFETFNKIKNIIENKDQFEKCQSEYCSWCKYFLDCEKTREHIDGIAVSKELVPINYHSSELVENPDAMGKLLDFERTIVKKWCDSVEYHAKEMTNNGMIPTGYKMQTGKGTKSICNISGLFNAAKLSEQEFLDCCTVSLTTLKEKLKLKKKDFDKLIENYISLGKPSSKLVKNSTKEGDENADV